MVAAADSGIDVIIVAAGASSRMESDTPKILLPVCGRPVILRCVDAFRQHAGIRSIVVITRESLIPALRELLPADEPRLRFAVGGATRGASVLSGMKLLHDTVPPSIVLVHDAARCLVSGALIERVIAATRAGRAAVPCVPVVDTVKRIDGLRVVGTVDRSELQAVQTPQGFHFADLWAAYAGNACLETDDCALVERALPVTVVPGERRNLKITTPDDLIVAEAFLQKQGEQ